MSDNLKEKIVCVVDDGMFVELACKLGESFKEVLYYSQWENPYPRMNEGMIGYGMPNITRVDNIWRRFDEVDLFVFPSVYFGELQLFIEKQGKRVWGSRRGENMEIFRDGMKAHMEDLGLPVGNYEVIKGMDALRVYLKSHKNVFVKINLWRGQFESFFSKNYKMIECKLNEIDYNLGPFADILDFIVEDELPDKVEIGSDLYTVDGKYPSLSLAGIECKDLGYVGEIRNYKDLPASVTDFNAAISDTLKGYGYKGFLSTEMRVGKDKVSYMIDMTCRCPSPPSELYQEMYINISEIIWEGSGGVLIDPIPAAKFGVQALIYSHWCEDSFLPLEIKEDKKRFIKLINATKIKGVYYIIPQAHKTDVVGSVIGMGDTLEAALENIKENSEGIKGYDIEIKMGSMDKIQIEMDKLKEFGIKLFSK